mmetsp:Transcript_66184/g.162958  ORF Transcript_66184/g.162958 Transcript_66184/m.162958 type:complete len:209 (-) Transcript_66184:296-922(-)
MRARGLLPFVVFLAGRHQGNRDWGGPHKIQKSGSSRWGLLFHSRGVSVGDRARVSFHSVIIAFTVHVHCDLLFLVLDEVALVVPRVPDAAEAAPRIIEGLVQEQEIMPQPFVLLPRLHQARPRFPDDVLARRFCVPSQDEVTNGRCVQPGKRAAGLPAQDAYIRLGTALLNEAASAPSLETEIAAQAIPFHCPPTGLCSSTRAGFCLD